MTKKTSSLPLGVLLCRTSEIIIKEGQPRKEFPHEGIAKLAASFREHGFDPRISKLLVRPGNEEGKYELITGERKFRAALLAGIKEVPITIADVGDEEVLDLQLLENHNREDLNPIDEAEALARRCETRSRKEVAAMLGMDEDTLKKKLSLVTLRDTAPGRALCEGSLPFAVARVLVTVPCLVTRDALFRRVMDHPGGPMAEKELRRIIRDEVQRELRATWFDLEDAKLVPVVMEQGARVMGGACSDCPFNSKNDPERWNGRQAMCGHPGCFETKRKKAHERWREEVGAPTLSLEESDGLWDHTGKRLSPATDWVDMAERPHDHLLRDLSISETWEKLCAGQDLPVTLAKDLEGRVHRLALAELAKTAEAERAAASGGESVLKGAKKRKVETSEDVRREEVSSSGGGSTVLPKAESPERDARAVPEMRAILAAARAMKRPARGFWELLIECLAAEALEMDGSGEFFEYAGVPVGEDVSASEALERYLKTVPMEHLPAVVMWLASGVVPPRSRPEWRRRAMEFFQISPETPVAD